MITDNIKIYQKIFEKMSKAVQNSDFTLCTSLSSEMLRISDYVDFIDGIFFGEFLESLFTNINSINANYIIEEAIINDLKNDIFNLISILRDSLPLDDNKKIEIYDLITKIRAKATRLQLESFRGEKKRKARRNIMGESIGRIRLPDLNEEIEIE